VNKSANKVQLSTNKIGSNNISSNKIDIGLASQINASNQTNSNNFRVGSNISSWNSNKVTLNK